MNSPSFNDLALVKQDVISKYDLVKSKRYKINDSLIQITNSLNQVSKFPLPPEIIGKLNDALDKTKVIRKKFFFASRKLGDQVNTFNNSYDFSDSELMRINRMIDSMDTDLPKFEENIARNFAFILKKTNKFVGTNNKGEKLDLTDIHKKINSFFDNLTEFFD